MEVHRTRHFGQAARSLFVTQAAVSTRIAQLERLIGTPVFLRQRNNIVLTPAGERLLVHAEAVMGAWNRMLLQTAGIASGKRVLALGCLPSINEILIEQRLPNLCRRAPEALLQVDTLKSDALISRIRARSLDAGLLYEPLKVSELSSNRVTQVMLVLVSTEVLEDLDGVRFIQLDWGGSFVATPGDVAFDVIAQVDSPRTARRLLLQAGGAALLPLNLVVDDIALGRLQQSALVPPVVRDLYFIQHNNPADELQAEALAKIFEVITEETAEELDPPAA